MPILKGDSPASVEQAVQQLQNGGLVAFATETVYGLGARADDDAAVARIFALKSRPTSHPLIVHVAHAQAASAFTDHLNDAAQKLIHTFWPGPLTMVVSRRASMATAAASGQNTIALRCPAHPVAQGLLQAAATQAIPGIAAPSANRFGRISPTLAAHVQSEFGPDLMVLDGGACSVGIESAIVDVSGDHTVLLRPGVLTRALIESALGASLTEAHAQSPRVSGSLTAHYAPRARLRLMSTATLQTAIEVLGIPLTSLGVYARSLRPHQLRGLRYKWMPNDAAAAAQGLFSALRELDAEGIELIWVEHPPETPEWAGVLDRLRRAAASAD
jgi:L-threonylcarbamoyladenylate synthase